MTIDTTDRRRDRAFLVATRTPDQTAGEAEELLQELAELTATFGADVVETCTVRVSKPRSRLYIGSGAAEEIVQRCRALAVNIIVFDHDLNPSQQRNWETLAKLPVIDRREVILDIFAARASTREASLQIELARAQYSLPRLKRAWTHLSRQRGNTKMRGEGEKQIEIDERMVRRRIAKLRVQLAEVRKQRRQQRRKRRRKPVPNAAIVGYTNAGKSLMLNRLTTADAFVEDKLFATLDTTTRRVVLPNNQTLLLTDTVGFVRRLPHTLVEAFKATLEEAVVADFLIHVVDVTSPALEAHCQTTRDVLEEIGAGRHEVVTVFNKIDRLSCPHTIRQLRRRRPDAVFTSMKTGEGTAELLAAVQRVLDRTLDRVALRIPHRRHDLVALVHRTSHVHAEAYLDDAVYLDASVPNDSRAVLQPFLAGEPMANR